MELRMFNDNVLVQLDPETDKVQGLAVDLYKPQGANEHVLRTGTVLKVGPGFPTLKGRKAMMATEGMRVLFIKFVATHTESAKSIQALIGKDKAIIKDYDILLDIGDTDPGAITQ